MTRTRTIAAAFVVLITLSAGSVAGARTRARSAVSPRLVRGWTSTECGTYSGKGCAPPADRVDLTRPTFSHPTQITNPLFPINRIQSVVLLGREQGKPFRSETTVLRETDTVHWDGERIPVVVSQYLAFRSGRIEELARDLYAQADDGSVWYLGEDVYDYADGAVDVTEGTWRAGRDGPPAMIMPAHPKIGDVFRSENVTGVVFEELRVTATGETVPGPSGPIHGAVRMDELHADGVTVSGKTFAPGYGEFITKDGADIEAVAVASSTDARRGDTPEALRQLVTGAYGALESTRLGDWENAQFIVRRLARQWITLRHGPLPPRIVAEITPALERLTIAIDHRHVHAASTAALDVAQGGLDLELLFRRPLDVDLERVHHHAQRLRVAAARHDEAAVTGEVATIEWTAQRVAPRLSGSQQRSLDAQLHDLRTASDLHNLAATGDIAARLAASLRHGERAV